MEQSKSVKSLRSSPVGQVIEIRGHDPRFNEDYTAESFLPHDLPDEIEIPGRVWMTLNEAATELGRLDGAACQIPNPNLIARITTRREAIGTSALEGTYANLAELYAAEALPDGDRNSEVSSTVSEVMNYTRAADMAYQWVADRPVTMGLLAALQAEIVRGTSGDGPDAGAIRTTQVFIGAKNRRVAEARFVPPEPGDQLVASCDRWLVWLTASDPARNLPLIARIAMAHYQFETLHPFRDGNGRVGRLVAVLQLLRENALRAPVLAISPWLEEHDDEYRDHLLNVSVSGDFSPWIEFFASAVRDESRSGHDRIMRLLALRDELRDKVRTEIPRGRLAFEIADDLIAYPILSVADSRRRHGKTDQANRDAIASLVEIGILEPYSDARYDRLFWSRRVFQAIA